LKAIVGQDSLTRFDNQSLVAIIKQNAKKQQYSKEYTRQEMPVARESKST
jgi:hypothetical protein